MIDTSEGTKIADIRIEGETLEAMALDTFRPGLTVIRLPLGMSHSPTVVSSIDCLAKAGAGGNRRMDSRTIISV